MDLNPSNFYNYFKECYRLDYKEFTIDNVLSSKYPYKWFATGTEELVAQQLPLIPYPNKKANDLAKEIALYDLEKKLFYGCFFLLGSSNNPLIKDKRICAPLLLFPATLKEIDDDYYISVDFNACDVNRSALSLLEVREELIQKDAFAQQLLEKFVATQNYIGLSGFLEKYVSNVTTEELLLFPTVWNAQKIRNEFKTAPLSEDEFKIIPAAGTVLVEKAASSLQVLNDLTELSEQGTFSTAMQQLLTSEVAIPKPYESYYQSRLNTDQYQALINAHAYENSVIVGPPGTGKTYTITSIISDAVVQNESVLVVSKTKQAVEVLRHMLQTDFKLKDYLIHTSGARYKMSLTAKINRYLSGIQNRKQSSFNAFKIEYLSKQLEKLEAEFETCVQEEIELSDLEFNADLNLLEKWKKFYLKRIVYNGTKIWSVFEKMNTVLLQLEEEISKHTQQKIADNIHRNSHTYRKDISLFHDALTSSSFSEYKRILETVIQKNVLKVFPIWLANLADLNAVLPLEKEMFDLVIIDEATQCDIASALPALYRAKRVVIAGDPNQLRHYSFVSKAQQFNLQKQYQLPEDKIFDYRNRSVLDLFIAKVATQAQVTFLREHFRSTPSLIAFSNQQFYDGQLEILKATPEYTQASQLTHILVEGERSKKGINEVEAQAVLEQLQMLIDAYANVSKKPSIGIISPFNSQVVYLKQCLQATFETSVLKRFDILCGTPYQFQGSEREIILLSFCVSKHTHHSAFNHINKPEVLNVAVTRAKSLQYVFTSVQRKDLTPDSLLERYLRFVKNFSHTEKQQPELDDFQQEVIQSLSKYKLDAIHCGYPVAGSLLDILIVHNEQNYFIDLIGYPGIYKEAFTLERYKTLGRTGITTIPLHYSFWQKNKPEAIKKIVAFIK